MVHGEVVCLWFGLFIYMGVLQWLLSKWAGDASRIIQDQETRLVTQRKRIDELEACQKRTTETMDKLFQLVTRVDDCNADIQKLLQRWLQEDAA